MQSSFYHYKPVLDMYRHVVDMSVLVECLCTKTI